MKTKPGPHIPQSFQYGNNRSSPPVPFLLAIHLCSTPLSSTYLLGSCRNDKLQTVLNDHSTPPITAHEHLHFSTRLACAQN